MYLLSFGGGCATTSSSDKPQNNVPQSANFPPSYYQITSKTTSLVGDAPKEEISIARHQLLPLEDRIIEETWASSGYTNLTLSSLDGVGQFRISSQKGNIAGVRQFIGTTWTWHRWESEVFNTNGSYSIVVEGQRSSDGTIVVNQVIKNAAGSPTSLVTATYKPISIIQFNNLRSDFSP